MAKTKAEIKSSLKNWMGSLVRSTHQKASLQGSKYNPSDISFIFRSRLGIKMNEKFVTKALQVKK